MDSYYQPEDLAKFGSIGTHAPKAAEDFFNYYGNVTSAMAHSASARKH